MAGADRLSPLRIAQLERAVLDPAATSPQSVIFADNTQQVDASDLSGLPNSKIVCFGCQRQQQ